MPVRLATIGLACLAGLLIAANTRAVDAVPGADFILTTNYDVVLVVGEYYQSIRSSAQLLPEHAVPVEMHPYKVLLKVTPTSDTAYDVLITVHEWRDPDWQQISTDTLKVSGEFGVPAQFVGESSDIKLDVALVVGKMAPDAAQPAI
jgi:hypothetical protein